MLTFYKKLNKDTFTYFKKYLLEAICLHIVILSVFTFLYFYFNLNILAVIPFVLIMCIFVRNTINRLKKCWKVSKYLASRSFEWFGLHDTDNEQDKNEDFEFCSTLFNNLNYGFNGGHIDQSIINNDRTQLNSSIRLRLQKIHPSFRWEFIKLLNQHNFGLSTYQIIQPLINTFSKEDIPNIETILTANKDSHSKISDIITIISLLSESDNLEKEVLINSIYQYFSKLIPDFINITKEMDIPRVDKENFDRLTLTYELSLKKFENTKTDIKKI